MNQFHLFFYFLWMAQNISRRKGIHKNHMRFFMLPSPKYVANFRLRHRFSRGERWIHTGRKWAPSSAPLAEKLIGGETHWRRNWMDFSVFLIVVHRFYILYSAFFTYAFCILHLCILHSSLMQKTFYKMHVYNVTCILNCILITIQLYNIPAPVSIAINILLLYNNL